MKDLINFPYVENVYGEEPFVNEVINKNHLVIEIRHGKRMDSLHHFQYFPEKKLVVLDSLLKRWAFALYLYVLIVVPFLFSEDFELFTFLGMTMAIFLACTIFLFWVVRSESSEMKRELDIRINYVLRTGRKVNIED